MVDERKQRAVLVIGRAEITQAEMRRGKECAQAAHASMAFITRRLSFPNGGPEARAVFSPPEINWLTTRFRKVTLQVDSEEELLEVYQRAEDAGLVVHLITDAGLAKLQDFPKLEWLHLPNGPGITANGVAKLRAARPKLMVTWDGDAKKE